MTILSGWPEQYARMRRSLALLEELASGQMRGSSDENRDALIHFFQDAYHLKDWIKNDESTSIDTTALECHIWDTPALSLCADVCNGTKHFKLTSTRTGDMDTAITSQSVAVRPAAASSGQPPDPPLHTWKVESGDRTYDALDLAREIVSTWDKWLSNNDLSIPT